MKAPASPPSPEATSSDRPARSVSYNPWPASIIATFVLFIGGTVGLVVLASKDRNDLVAADYYEQEIRYQQRIDQLHRTEPLSDEIKATFDCDNRQLMVKLPAKQAASGIAGDIQLYRPNHAGADRSFPLAPNPEGVQSIPAKDLKPGLWKVRLQWTSGANEFFADRQVLIPTPTQPATRTE